MNQHPPMWATIVAGIGLSITVLVVLIVYPDINQPLATLAAVMATAVAVATSVRRRLPPGPGPEPAGQGDVGLSNTMCESSMSPAGGSPEDLLP